MKEAAVQRRHNLYRDSIVLSNSDPNLHLLGETPSIDWAGEFGGAQEEAEDGKTRRMKQVVSMIQVDDCVEKTPLSPSVADLQEESGGDGEKATDVTASPRPNGGLDTGATEAEGGGAEEQKEEQSGPVSSQVASEEELPPPPPEEVLSAALETSSPEEESDFPPPPQDDDDSGFQSPTAETEEGPPGQSAAS